MKTKDDENNNNNNHNEILKQDTKHDFKWNDYYKWSGMKCWEKETNWQMKIPFHVFVEWKKAAKNRTNEKRFPIQFALNKSWILDGYGWAQSVLMLTIFFFSIKRAEKKITNWDQPKFIYHLVNIQHGIEQFPCQKKKNWQWQKICTILIEFRVSEYPAFYSLLLAVHESRAKRKKLKRFSQNVEYLRKSTNQNQKCVW